MVPDSSHSPRFDAGPLGRVVLMVLLTLAVLIHVIEIHSRGIDPDELEHLHAAFLVWLGDVPYRDFFEHHGPAFYYAAQPLFALQGPELSVLWAGRTCMWLCSLGILALTGLLARRVGGQGVGLPAATLLAFGTVFHLKGIEFRPDVPAALLLLGAVLTWSAGAGSRRIFLAGLLAGIATLFTQKSIVPASGLWLGHVVQICLCSSASATATPADACRTPLSLAGRVTLCFALGGVLPWLCAFGLFATAGAADDLWRGAVYQLWIWPLRSNLVGTLQPIAVANLGLYVAALIELVCPVWRRLTGKRPIESEPDLFVVMVALAWCLLSLLWVKAAYAQYHFLWQPLLAVLAARRVVAWTQRPDNWRFVLTVGIPALALSVIQLLLWTRALSRGTAGAFPWLASIGGLLERLAVAVPWCLLLLLGSTLFAASCGYRRRAILYLLVLAQFYGLLRVADTLFWHNIHKVELIESVHKSVPANGRVLDGFTGGGALRRHALYYWWINDYSRALMQQSGAESRLRDELRDNPPDAVLFDQEIEKLPHEVVDWLRAHYELSTDFPLWLPKGKRSP